MRSSRVNVVSDDVHAHAIYGPGTNIPEAAGEILRLINDRQSGAAA